jgi:hypothetical protein
VAVTDSYASPATYRFIANKDDVTEDTEIAADLAAVSRWIDRRVGRFFTKDAAAVDRDYTVLVDGWLRVDDLAAVPVSVLVDENNDGTPEVALTHNTDFVLEPRNAADGPEPTPYQKIIIPPWSTRWFSRGYLVRVNAVFGWPAVPKAIERAACQLTAVLRLEGPRASRSISDTGEILEASPNAQGIIERLVLDYSRKAYAV